MHGGVGVRGCCGAVLLEGGKNGRRGVHQQGTAVLRVEAPPSASCMPQWRWSLAARRCRRRTPCPHLLLYFTPPYCPPARLAAHAIPAPPPPRVAGAAATGAPVTSFLSYFGSPSCLRGSGRGGDHELAVKQSCLTAAMPWSRGSGQRYRCTCSSDERWSYPRPLQYPQSQRGSSPNILESFWLQGLHPHKRALVSVAS